MGIAKTTLGAWAQRLQKGEFRQVPFLIESHSLSTGRRKADHEFPQRDKSRSEDMGRKIRTFSVEMIVLGDDYFQQRDALLDALEKEGSGELIHPYLGKKQVQVGSVSLSESKGDGRLAKFSVEFTETGEIIFPLADDDALTTTLDQADIVQVDSRSAFEKAFDASNQPAQVINDSTAKLNQLGDDMDSAIKKVTEPVANLTFAISNYKASINDLISKPGELAAKIQGVFDALFNEFDEDPRTGERILGVFIGSFGPFDPIISSSASAVQTQKNSDAIFNIGQQQGLSVQAKTAVNSDFISANDAISVRDRIVENFDVQLNVDGLGDDLFQNIQDLQSSLTKALPPLGLGELIKFTPPKTMPALVIAHDLFHNLEKEAEILEQNDIDHPGFVSGGVEIEVSSG